MSEETMTHEETMTLIALLEKASKTMSSIGEKQDHFPTNLIQRRIARQFQATLGLAQHCVFSLVHGDPANERQLFQGDSKVEVILRGK